MTFQTIQTSQSPPKSASTAELNATDFGIPSKLIYGTTLKETIQPVENTRIMTPNGFWGTISTTPITIQVGTLSRDTTGQGTAIGRRTTINTNSTWRKIKIVTEKVTKMHIKIATNKKTAIDIRATSTNTQNIPIRPRGSTSLNSNSGSPLRTDWTTEEIFG